MIQRKQTIWLLLASFSAFLSIKFPFYSGNVVDANTSTKSLMYLTAQQPSLLILIITIAIALSSIALIFLYKSRPKQLLYCIGLIIISLINLVLFLLETKKFVDGTYSLTAILTGIIPVLICLAAFGIYKDEKLVKSADRLR
jgi:Na+/melibiose symporter-like transporter